MKLIKIKEIRKIGKKKTIDIQVSKNNLFIANNILTHNCAFNTSSPGMETVAESIGLPATCDVMLSIWQTEEDRELGIINMGMQKNRFGPNFGHGTFKCNYETLTLKEVNPDHFESEDPQSALNEATTALDKLTN